MASPMKPATSMTMSPMKSPHKMPAVAQARSVINRLQRLTDSVNQSAAAMSTYATENQQAPIVAESQAVRAHMTSESEALQVSLLGHLKDLQDMRRTVDSASAREAELKTQVGQLQAEVTSLREGELSLAQALDSIDAAQVSGTSSQEVSGTSSQGDRPSPGQQLADTPKRPHNEKQSTKSDSKDSKGNVSDGAAPKRPDAEAGHNEKQSEQSRKRDSKGIAKGVNVLA